MLRLGELARSYNKTIAYEAVCWGMYVNHWQHVRDIIHLVNLPNVKHCLDTFHIAASEASDPFNAECLLQPGSLSNLRASLKEMKQTVKAEDIGYIQLSDATVGDSNQTNYPQRDLMAPP